jgi:glycosyltransferase involved in cell wall biosynthesis
MKCGGITAPENPKQLAKTIQYVFDDPDIAIVKVREGCKRFEREYGLEVMEDRISAFLKNIESERDSL